MPIKESAKKFKKEVKKSVVSAVVAAFGLLTALAWKDVITEYLDKVVSLSPVGGKIVAALIITVLSVIVIMLISRYASD